MPKPKAGTQRNTKPRRRAPPASVVPKISGVSADLEALIVTHDGLPRDGWPAACDIRNSHGEKSLVGKNVDHVWSIHYRMVKEAVRAVIAYPARGPADLAAKLAFLGQDYVLLTNYKEAMPALLADATRLAQTGASDAPLLALARETETAYEIHKVMWARYRTGGASYDAAREASKTTGPRAQAMFKHKARSLEGVLAKLRIVAAAYGTGNSDGDQTLEAYQRDDNWLGSTIADLERLAGKGGAA